MKHMKTIVTNEKGVVLALSIFMLALLSMIGMAAMMSGTTEIDIAGNEKFHQDAFFQADSGLTISTEVIEVLDGYDSFRDYVDSGDYFDDNQTIKINDLSALFENRDIKTEAGKFGKGNWDKDNQTEDDISLSSSSSSSDNIPDLQVLSNALCADCDIDKADTRHLVGGGAEFGSGAEGKGVSTHGVIYNLDCIGRVPAKRSISSEHIWGFLFIPH